MNTVIQRQLSSGTECTITNELTVMRIG